MAKRLDFEYYSKQFHEAYEILLGKNIDIPDWMESIYAFLKNNEDQLRLFLAVEKTYVFGGMGTWNDSPAWAAASKGIEEEYNQLTNNLYNQIKLAIMYSVNK